MQDRLGELKEIAKRRNPAAAVALAANESSRQPGSEIEDGGPKDIEAGIAPGAESDFMKEYFDKIEVMKTAIDEIAKSVAKIRSLKQETIEATSPDKEREISQNLNKVVSGANMMLTKTKRAMEAVNKENIEFAAKQGDSAEARIRTNMHQALARQFKTVFQDYQAAQTEYKQEAKTKVTRQVKIVFPEATQEEVRQLIDEGNITSAMAIRSRVSGGHELLRNAVADLEDKHRDIRRLEENIADLHQMFVEVATVVEHQGELLDQIEFSVSRAKEYTEKAETELVSARKYQESAKKRMCWIIICLLVLLLIIILPSILIPLLTSG